MSGMYVCPICGTRRVICWPEFWVYRRGGSYFCSENCMDISLYRDLQLLNSVKRKRSVRNMTSITLEQKKHAVDMAKRGENPLPYLQKCGAKNPTTSWQTIRKHYLATHEGEDLPEKFGHKKAEPNATSEYVAERNLTKDEAPTVKVDGGLKTETPDADQIKVVEIPEDPQPFSNPRQPLMFDGYTVRCIEGKYGRFFWDYNYNRLDWTSPEGEEVNMSPQAWTAFCTEIMPKVMAILGVNP